MGRAETERSIANASGAMPEWSALTASKRASILHRWYSLILDNGDDLARIMVAEQGKPMAEAKGEVATPRHRGGVVRRGSQTRVRRGHPDARSRHQGVRHASARGRLRRHHALELSPRDDHEKSGGGVGGGLRRRREALRGDAAERVRAGCPRGARGFPARDDPVHHRRSRGHRRRADLERRRSKAVVHGIHGGWQDARREVRCDGEERLARARR